MSELIEDKNKLLIENSETIVKALYCNPKSIVNEDFKEDNADDGGDVDDEEQDD